MLPPSTDSDRLLLLLRHAKSSQADAHTPDHERPLNARGRRAATSIGEYMQRSGLGPTLVLCSSARRTRETFELTSPCLAHAPELRVEQELYLASSSILRRYIEASPESVTTLLVIAHNPGIEDLARELALAGEADSWRALHSHYPAGALAVLRSSAPSWSAFAGELLAFVPPRELPSD